MGRKLTEEQKAERRFKMRLKKAKAAKAAARAANYESTFGYASLTAKPYEKPLLRTGNQAAMKNETRFHNARPK